jgi:hypothetical protein
MPFEYEALRAKTQQTLTEFLDVELKLGHTMAQSAMLSYDEGHTDHYEQAKRHATRAADSIRRFMTGVADGKIRNEIEGRLAELERLISTL